MFKSTNELQKETRELLDRIDKSDAHIEDKIEIMIKASLINGSTVGKLNGSYVGSLIGVASYTAIAALRDTKRLAFTVCSRKISILPLFCVITGEAIGREIGGVYLRKQMEKTFNELKQEAENETQFT